MGFRPSIFMAARRSYKQSLGFRPRLIPSTLVSIDASLRPVSKFLKTVVTASISLLERRSGDQEVLGDSPLTRLSPTPALLIPVKTLIHSEY